MKHFTSSPEKGSILQRTILPLAVWLLIWWGLSTWVGKELLIPTPMAVARCLVALLGTPLFWRSTGLSLLRIFCGSAGGMGAGVILAVFTSKCRWADWVISPAIRVVRSVPVASFILLVLLWIQNGFVPAVISGLMVMPVLWQNVSQGIQSTDPQLVELARAYAFGSWKTLRYVYLPAVQPYLISGVCTAVGLGWKAGVAAEVLCLPKAGIGTQVYYSKLYLESPSLFAWTIVVILLSMAVEHLVRRVLHQKGGVRQ